MTNRTQNRKARFFSAFLVVLISAIVLLTAFQLGISVQPEKSQTTTKLNPSAVPGVPSYLVTFEESGLPATLPSGYYGAVWGVDVAGTVYKTSSADLTFQLAPGSYTYSLLSLNSFQSSPSSGSFNVTNSNVFISVTFSASVNSVVFTENGLPSSSAGTEWSVVFNGTSFYSNTSVLSVTVPNGVYQYQVPSNGPFNATPANGRAVVNGSNLNVPVTFVSTFDVLTFFETGLPTYQGAIDNAWSVNVYNPTNGFNVTESSGIGFLNFSMPSGTYTYTVSPIPGFSVSPSSGSVTVDKNYVSVTLNFTSMYQGIKFNEQGLPVSVSNGPSVTPLWKVQLLNSSQVLNLVEYSQSQDIFFNVTNGIYQYIISSVSGYSPFPGTGYVTVTNGFYQVNIQFSNSYGYLKFKEKGLFSNTTSPSKPVGSSWSVTVLNSVNAQFEKESNSNTITFWLPYGSYTYYATNNTGYSVANETGTATVALQTKTYNVSYTFTSALSQSSGQTAALNVYEVGLPASTNWQFAISNATRYATFVSTTSALSTLYEPNGTYYLRFLDVGNYHPTTTAKILTIDTSTQLTYNLTITYTSLLGSLVFNENGLAGGQQWSVVIMSLSNISTVSTTVYHSLSIQLTNGSYFYRVIAPYSYLYPSVNSSGFVYVSALRSVQINLSYAYGAYAVNFSESGLPSNSLWELLLNNPNGTVSLLSSTSGSLSVALPNGTYHYSVIGPANYQPTTSRVTFTVSGNSSVITQNITFSSNLYSVNFIESGLPSGTTWSVFFNGQMQSSNLGKITFKALGGTYTYQLVSTGGYLPLSSTGSVYVSSKTINVNVDFVSFFSTVTFTESGLPANYAWSVAFNNVKYDSTTSTLNITVQNGTYLYAEINQGNYYPEIPFGYLTVSGSNSKISVIFQSDLYTVSFEESGLPTGQSWTLQVTNYLGVATDYTSTSTFSNVSLENGAYNYQILVSDFYVPTPSSGTVQVSGTAVVQHVSYKIYQYAQYFNETGLPDGSIWNITLISSYGQKYTLSSDTASGTFNLVNASYTYSIVSANKSWKPSAYTGSFTVNGNTNSIDLSFSQIVFTIAFEESGLPSGTSWSIVLNGERYASNTSFVNITMPNGTYDFASQNITDYHGNTQTGKIVVNGANVTTTVTYAENVTVIKPPPVSAPGSNYNTYIVVGTLVGVGVIGLGIIMTLYFQRKNS